MARVYLTNLDLSKNSLLNAVVQVLATAPSSPVEGQLYYDSVLKVARIFDGTGWVSMEENVAIDFGESSDITSSAPGDTVSAGSTGEVADAGHRHAREAMGGSGDIASSAVGDTAAAGSSGKVADAAHRHARESFGTVGTSSSFGQSASDGAASTPARSSHQHAIPAHDGSAHSAVSLSSLATPTGDIALGGYKITGLGAPSSSTDAATRGFVESAIGDAVAGLSWKDSVRVASSSSVTISNPGTSSIGGASLSSGDRVLLYGQSTASQNGLYLFNGASAALTRATDADTAADLRGAAVFVEEGTDAGKQFILSTDNFTLGTDDLTFTQFGSSTTYSAGNGLTLSGSTFNVGAGTGITVNADDVAVDTSLVARYKVLDITGNGSSTSFALTHSLQQWVSVQIIDAASPYDQVECDVERTSSTQVTVKFATAPANLKAYKVIVVG